ncbi:xanthine dehydrogenase accessory protein XdhC [Tatumella saanichensis]|uniref:xanthine dehydrogenase accessory protein XdhC n=1 Tax=Tatumella saanichensis TaxID=480813 RepID=UPI0004A24959|nr:xanthine dehydrogenase accessory protein XdhC [Tatumella saanichensis]
MHNEEWIPLLNTLQQQRQPCVLITIMAERGSVPRGGGSKMVVTAQQSWLTIGGGNLEYRCMDIARQMLQQQDAEPRCEQFPLAARSGQCCGGAVTVLFEPLITPQPQIIVFGAGHVGRALTSILSTLPCHVIWADSRSEYLTHPAPGVELCLEEELSDVVSRAAAGSYFVVMTHNHDLDLHLTEQILRREDFRYLGVIGSQTKSQRFRYRLRGKGISDQQLEKFRCPAGLNAVTGKLPAEIAVSISGEIIAEYQRQSMQ